MAAYRTRAVAEGAEALAAALRAGDVDAVTFTSSSTVTNLLACLGGPSLLEGADLYSIGPVTTETLRAAGLEPVSYTHLGCRRTRLRLARARRSSATTG